MKTKLLLFLLFLQLVFTITHKKHSLRSKLKKKTYLHHKSKAKYAYQQDPPSDPTKPKKITPMLVSNPLESQTETDFPKFLSVFKNHHLTIGEIKTLYVLADLDRNGFVGSYEWSHFYRLFVDPFQQCDQDGDFLLNLDELTACFQTEWLIDSGITKDNMTTVFLSLNKLTDDPSTFTDYVFLRRVNLAWKQCSGDLSLSISKVDCAILVIVPEKHVDLPDAIAVVGIKNFLKYGKYWDRVAPPYISITELMYIANLYRYFTDFEIPFIEGILHKKDVIRAVNRQMLPSGLNYQVIQMIFTDYEEMDFGTFAVLLYCFNMFRRNSKINPDSGLTKEEFLAVLDEEDFPKAILSLIDQATTPTFDLIYLAATRVGGSIPGEKDYLINFLQLSDKQFDQMKFTQTSQIIKVEPNPANREVFYNILGLISANEVRKIEMDYNLPIVLNKNDRLALSESQQFLGFSLSFQLNYRHFIDFALYREIFKGYLVPGYTFECTQGDFKSGLTQLNLTVINVTVNMCRQSSDPIVNLPLFNFRLGVQESIKNEVIAAKLQRDNITSAIDILDKA